MSDGPNMVPLDLLEGFLEQVRAIDRLVRNGIGPVSLDWCER